MSQVLTLVAPRPLADADLAAFEALGSHASTERRSAECADLTFSDAPDMEAVQALAGRHEVDYARRPSDDHNWKLLIADMDSTMIEQECLDELAAAVGIGEEIADITERAMRGELDFEEALRARVSRLKGVDAKLREDVIRDRLTLSSGARDLIQAARAAGVRTVLVSGGFDVFVEAIATRCGFDAWHANTLGIGDDGRLTGDVVPPILGREAKAAFLRREAEIADANPAEAVAIGDGANDLGMIGLAGLGIAYRAKPIVAAAADASIQHTSLASVATFMGLAP